MHINTFFCFNIKDFVVHFRWQSCIPTHLSNLLPLLMTNYIRIAPSNAYNNICEGLSYLTHYYLNALAGYWNPISYPANKIFSFVRKSLTQICYPSAKYLFSISLELWILNICTKMTMLILTWRSWTKKNWFRFFI